MALDPSNSSNLKQLALNGLILKDNWELSFCHSFQQSFCYWSRVRQNCLKIDGRR